MQEAGRLWANNGPPRANARRRRPGGRRPHPPAAPALGGRRVPSHALTNRPLVVRDTDVIEIGMKSSREAAFLAIDGQQGMSVADGDIVQCRKSELQVKLLKLPERSFFDVLRMKLKWGER